MDAPSSACGWLIDLDFVQLKDENSGKEAYSPLMYVTVSKIHRMNVINSSGPRRREEHDQHVDN